MAEVVCPAPGGERLDKLIAQLFPGVSRGAARKLIGAGAAFVDGKRCRIASFVVRSGQRVRVSEGVALMASADLAILYEDDLCIVVNKPASMPSAPTQSAAAGTALETLRQQLRKQPGRVDLKLVHRLDVGTSGVLLFAKTKRAAAYFSKAFQEHRVTKTYVARVGGRLDEVSGVIDLPLARRGKRMVVANDGQAARTAWQVRHAGEGTSLVELQPETGRMHQIRAHLQAIGHPVVGDCLYGGAPAPRLMLHAQRLQWRDASGTERAVEAPVPPELAVLA